MNLNTLNTLCGIRPLCKCLNYKSLIKVAFAMALQEDTTGGCRTPDLNAPVAATFKHINNIIEGNPGCLQLAGAGARRENR